MAVHLQHLQLKTFKLRASKKRSLWKTAALGSPSIWPRTCCIPVFLEAANHESDVQNPRSPVKSIVNICQPRRPWWNRSASIRQGVSCKVVLFGCHNPHELVRYLGPTLNIRKPRGLRCFPHLETPTATRVFPRPIWIFTSSILNGGDHDSSGEVSSYFGSTGQVPKSGESNHWAYPRAKGQARPQGPSDKLPHFSQRGS